MQTHLLYLNLDNSLHDCVEVESGDVIDSDIVQDYKKMSIRLSQPGSKASKHQPFHVHLTSISHPFHIHFNGFWMDFGWICLGSLLDERKCRFLFFNRIGAGVLPSNRLVHVIPCSGNYLSYYLLHFLIIYSNVY